MRPHGAIAQLKHRKASGRLDSGWEYDPARRRVLIWLPIGPDVVDAEIPVCTNAHPHPNRWVVVRRAEDHWTLTASLWPTDLRDIARGMAFHPSLPVGSIELTHAPPDVAVELGML